LRFHTTDSSWKPGCPVSTHTTSVGPTVPCGVETTGMAFEARRPEIRCVMRSRPPWS
jgi:hypothetical protein